LEFALHHVGIVVKRLPTRACVYGYEALSDVIEDPVQTALVQFLGLKSERSTIEIVSPLGPDSKLRGALAANRRLNHLCYAVEDLDGACARLRREGLFMIHKPVEAATFKPRRIAWLMDRDGIPDRACRAGEDSRERRAGSRGASLLRARSFRLDLCRTNPKLPHDVCSGAPSWRRCRRG
jgi:methylmalonyl-CoA/ethylmalonyl-CoA epimerase